jgi:hypothetical protein
MFLTRRWHISLETMSKKHLILRLACFVTVYPLFYAVPIFLLWVLPLSMLKRLPAEMVNYLFILPVLTFPFDKISSDNGSSYIFDEAIGCLIMMVYLAMLGFLFLRLTRPIYKLRWLIPFTFCFCAISIFLLSCFFMVLGILVHIDSP